jgi:hypothetical protein
LGGDKGKEVTVKQVADELGIGESAALRRVEQAEKPGFLQNRETRKEYRARLVLGEPLPEECEVLPSVDDPRLTGITDKQELGSSLLSSDTPAEIEQETEGCTVDPVRGGYSAPASASTNAADFAADSVAHNCPSEPRPSA